MLEEYVPDSLRTAYFVKTISYLKQFGDVYLVRLPVAEEMLELEKQAYPDFSGHLGQISKAHQVPFIDLTYLSNRYLVPDGNHIYYKSVASFNKILATEISNRGIGKQ
jgi:hypothetical protein